MNDCLVWKKVIKEKNKSSKGTNMVIIKWDQLKWMFL
jgi:hypothetical protein